MATATLSTKGQIVIPSEIRQALGMQPGMTFEIEAAGGCIILRPVHEVPRTTLDDLIGCTGYAGPGLSLEEMEQGIAVGARRQQ